MGYGPTPTDGMRIKFADACGVKIIVFFTFTPLEKTVRPQKNGGHVGRTVRVKNNQKQLINDLKNNEITQHFGFA
jgi:peroxiredoxin family protein